MVPFVDHLDGKMEIVRVSSVLAYSLKEKVEEEAALSATDRTWIPPLSHRPTLGRLLFLEVRRTYAALDLPAFEICSLSHLILVSRTSAGLIPLSFARIDLLNSALTPPVVVRLILATLTSKLNKEFGFGFQCRRGRSALLALRPLPEPCDRSPET